MPEKLKPGTLQKMKRTCNALYPPLRQFRRELHQHPELSGEESWTSAYLAEKLDGLGLQVKAGVGGHGVVADLVTDISKATVALRVDMDALPIHEINDVPYRSRIPGVMHACGHDVHSAIGIGTAMLLKAMGDELPGNVRFIFQPEEEEITGALRMIRAGVLSNPTPLAIFGLHVAPIQAGKIAWTDGLFLSGFDHYLCTLSPQEGTALSPTHLNAVAERCCQVIQNFNHWELPQTWQAMQSFWQSMQEGPHNLRHFIIYSASRNEEDPGAWPGQFGIGVKAASQNLRRSAIGRIRASLYRLCKVTQTRFHLEKAGTMIDMRNDSDLMEVVYPALEHIIGPSNTIQLQAAFPFNCEDFAYYTKHIPGLMIWLGAADRDAGKYAMLHTPDFDVDESCLKTGVLAMAAMIIKRLS